MNDYDPDRLPKDVTLAAIQLFARPWIPARWKLKLLNWIEDCGGDSSIVLEAIKVSDTLEDLPWRYGALRRQRHVGAQHDDAVARAAVGEDLRREAWDYSDKCAAERRADGESWKRVFAFTNALSDAEFDAAKERVIPTLPCRLSEELDPRRSPILCSSIKRLLESESTP